MATCSASFHVRDGDRAQATTQRHPPLNTNGKPWIVLSIKDERGSEIALITDQPKLLEQIAVKASNLAAWLRSEAETKLHPETVPPG